MLWPSCLPDVALYTSFHRTQTSGDTDKYKMSRYTFFWLIFSCAFVYQWLPGYFMTCLKLVSVLCFLSTNKTIRLLGSGDSFEGTGILGLSFDWSVIAMTGPLLSPFWASVNFFVQAVFWGWIVIPLVHFVNPFKAPELEGQYPYGNQGDRFPSINSNRIYDRHGKVAEPVQFVTFPDLRLNETMYEKRGPFYLASSFSINYLCSFMNIAAVFSHVMLWYGSSIWKQMKKAFGSLKDEHYTDIHNRLMQAYRDIPDWIYAAWFLFFLVVQLLVCTFTPFRMPIWATLFAVFLGGSLTIPIGIIQAVTGSQMGLNVLTEFIIGFMLPGETVAVMTFKSLGYNVMIQALDLTKHLKIAHYMHISPISMVAAQLLGSVLGAFLNTGAVFWVLRTFKNELIDVSGEWSATGYRTFAAAGSVWGAIGPARFFGFGSPYASLLLGFPIGFLLPFLPWLLNKWRPSPYWRLIHFPLLTQGIPSGTNQAIIVVPFIIAFVFNYWIFRYRKDWWKKYNFILSCGLDSGVAISTLIIAFWRQVGSSGDPVWALRPSTNTDYYCRDVSHTGV
jgi:OPT family small oligopeptide transporter